MCRRGCFRVALKITALRPEGAAHHCWALPERVRIEVAPADEQAGPREKRLADMATRSDPTLYRFHEEKKGVPLKLGVFERARDLEVQERPRTTSASSSTILLQFASKFPPLILFFCFTLTNDF